MGFWSFLDKLVSYIPVVGTVKDSVEALVLECENKPEAAKAKFVEAAVDLVGDVVTVATCGAGYEVAAMGKATAELAIKEGAEFALKQGAEAEVQYAAKTAMATAAKHGLSKQATAAYVGAAAGAATKAKLKERIATKNGKRYRPPSPVPDEPRKKEKDPKKGHHVINNGVRKILPKIINDFLHHNAHYFHAQSIDQLVTQGHLRMSASVYKKYKAPLQPADDNFIEVTTAYTPDGETHVDPNDMQFSIVMTSLRVAASNYMSMLFQVLLNDPSQINRLDQNVCCNNMAVSISGVIHEINTMDIYVDQQALRWWLNEGGNMSIYREVHQSVAEMFQLLTHRGTPTGGMTARAELITWVRELYAAYESINGIRVR